MFLSWCRQIKVIFAQLAILGDAFSHCGQLEILPAFSVVKMITPIQTLPTPQLQGNQSESLGRHATFQIIIFMGDDMDILGFTFFYAWLWLTGHTVYQWGDGNSWNTTSNLANQSFASLQILSHYHYILTESYNVRYCVAYVAISSWTSRISSFLCWSSHHSQQDL